ncbi:MAG: T9SS C-terminal target domain-containing protein, partial [Marinilabiliales bacterium]
QAYAVDLITLYTDSDGQAGFEAVSGTYSYIVEKEGYSDASANFDIENSGLVIDVQLESDVSYVIDDMAPEILKVYPNPAYNFIIVESEKLLRELRVIDISGQVIIHVDVNAHNRELAVGSLPAGVYLLRVELEPGGDVVIRRFVVSR